MTLVVEFGLAIGAGIPTDVLVIGSATQGIIGTNVIGTFNMLADFSGREMSLSVQRTSDRTAGPLVTYNAGTCTLKMLNIDGSLDPYVLEQQGLTAPGVIMRIRKWWSGTLYPIFYGYVDSWNPEADAPTLGTITVTATDGLSLLNTPMAELVSPVGAGESSVTRISRILNDLSWPASLRSFSSAQSTVQATSYGASGLDLIRKATEAEVGEFYQQPDGKLAFRGRTAILTDSRGVTSQATFGSDRGAGEIPYVGRPSTAWDRTQMHNRVLAQIEGSTNPQVVEDAASVGRYGTGYGVEVTDLILQDDADALSWANYVLAQDSVPEYRFDAITLNSAVEQLGISVMPHMLGRKLGDRVTVVRRPPAVPYGSIVDSRELYIRGISHDWSAQSKQWLTTFDLQPVSGLPFFIIGSSTQGVIGQNVIAW